MNYGKAFKTLRFNWGITQTQVAKKVGITQTYLSQIEGGTKIPSQDVIDKICKNYGIPFFFVAWLAFEDTDVKKSKLASFKAIKPAIDNLINEFI